MGSLEASIVTSIKKYLRSRGDCYFVKTAPPIEAGTPDLLCCVAGHFVGIEVKQEGRYPTELQYHRHKQIRAAGGTVVVARSVVDVAEVLDGEWAA